MVGSCTGAQTCDALKNSARMEISMKKKKIKNPLIRRIPRELTGDWKKYLVVSLFLILMIGFVSGMYVANESMMTAADEGVGLSLIHI